LAIIDNLWKEHLRDLDELKQSVQNASYEQKDPLLIYKFESFELFKVLLGKVNKEVVSFLFKADLPNAEKTQVSQAPERRQAPRTQESRPDQVGGTRPSQISQGGGAPRRAQQPPKLSAPVQVENKIGRNDPCPCGSGKKYKQCHGKGQPA
jgi:preprotein translocase subunit SecA